METKSCIKFYPNVNVKFIKVEKEILGMEQSLDKLDEVHSSTVLVTDYSDDVNAKYFPSSGELEGTKFSIYRKSYYQTYYDYLCTLEESQIFVKDHNIKNNEYYHYLTAAEITKTDGSKEYLAFENKDDNNTNVFINTNWDKLSICDIEETEDENIYKAVGDVWLFQGNLDAGEITQNQNIVASQTLGRFDKFYSGERNFDSGKISCLLGNVQSYSCLKDNNLIGKYGYSEKHNIYNYFESGNEKIRKWKDFCNNGKKKIMKDIAGNHWIVYLIDNPSRSTILSNDGNVTTINFSWEEALDKDIVSVIETV